MNTPPVLTAVCSVTLCSVTLWPCLGCSDRACSDQGADAVAAVDPTDEPHPVRGVPAVADVPEPLPTFETPESCWAALIKAKETDNPVAHLQCLAAGDRDVFVGKLAYEVERVSFMWPPEEGGEAAERLLRRHGLVDTDIMGALQIAVSPAGGGTGPVFEAVGNRIRNQPTFAAAATELLKSVHPEGTWGTDGVVPTLSNVTVQETYASGTLEVEGLEEPVPVVFILENGSWRFSSKSLPNIDGPDGGTP